MTTNPETIEASRTGAPPFNRAELDAAPSRVLNEGRWGNARIRLFEKAGVLWAIKDFLPCAGIVRETWGRHMVNREMKALRTLAGVPGVPSGAFQVDAYALAYRFVEGATLPTADPALLTPEFFESLERTVLEMHARGLTHLDLRYRQNILVTPEGTPVIIDFQSHIGLAHKPRVLTDWLRNVDLCGVYKHWALRHPETLGSERTALLERVNRRRRFWFLKGYAGIAPPRRRRNEGGD